MQRKRHQAQSSSQPKKKQFTGPSRQQVQQRPPQEGHKAANCLKSKGSTTGRAYVMHTKVAEAAPDSTLIAGVATHALIDSGATHSFISESFVKRLGIIPVDMDLDFRVSIPSGDQMFTFQIVKRLELRLQKKAVQADLIVLPLQEFDIILDMDWLSSHGAVIDFSPKERLPGILSQHCISDGASQAEDVDVVNEFSSVFSDNVSGIPLDREVDFSTELMPWTVPISKAPYRLALVEMKELKDQIQDLLDKGWHRGQPQQGRGSKRLAIFEEREEIHSFLGLAGYYRKFIQGFSSIVVPMTGLTKKNAKFIWGPECQESFDRLKQAMTTMPVLAMPSGQGECVVYTDSYKLGLGAVLMQQDRMIAYASRQMKVHEKNYLTHDLELAAVETFTMNKYTELYIREIVRLHGTPLSIVSDRDTRFTSTFWKNLHQALSTKLLFSTSFHSQTDDQSEKGSWEPKLPLVEFTYNNIYQASIGMAPYEALYGKKCRSSVYWDEVGERAELGPDIFRQTAYLVAKIRDKMRTAQSRQKSYDDQRRRALEFAVGDHVFVKVAPMKGVMRFGKKGKLSPRFIGSFETLDKVGTLACFTAESSGSS
ncbi:uncharacterized protein [Primulina eburnea]|uniref:uncharacterized protein n=1 Tax=Primulina eburnea TaxID=1245227 RepID=UPI003C6CA7A7